MTLAEAQSRIELLEKARMALCVVLNANAPRRGIEHARYDSANHHLIQPFNDEIYAIRGQFPSLIPPKIDTMTPRSRRALRDEDEYVRMTSAPEEEDED